MPLVVLFFLVFMTTWKKLYPISYSRVVEVAGIEPASEEPSFYIHSQGCLVLSITQCRY